MASPTLRRNWRTCGYLPEPPEALARLKERDFLLLVITNQPDVARGTQKRDTSRTDVPPAARRAAARRRADLLPRRSG